MGQLTSLQDLLSKAQSQKSLWARALFIFLLSLATLYTIFLWPLLEQKIAIGLQPLSPSRVQPYFRVSRHSTLGVADRLYVISLPTRTDRRREMEMLRQKLGLHWIYVDALSANSALVHAILDWVRGIRAGIPMEAKQRASSTSATPLSGFAGRFDFIWPEDINRLVYSEATLDFWRKGPWPLPTILSNPTTLELGRPLMACATRNYSVPTNTTQIREHLILTPSRVACWHSHMSVIHTIANAPSHSPDAVSIILEDDADMEEDIHSQLRRLWRYLPPDWDIVFLGHCWSNESYHPAISPLLSVPDNAEHSMSSNSRLYPSFGPKCTHAYALSRPGARRLLLHLTYPPFAYSRAIDQAFSWLVVSGRLKSFSVAPSLVVQRKIQSSDVSSGVGSKWKDHLVKGVLSSPRGS